MIKLRIHSKNTHSQVQVISYGHQDGGSHLCFLSLPILNRKPGPCLSVCLRLFLWSDRMRDMNTFRQL